MGNYQNYRPNINKQTSQIHKISVKGMDKEKQMAKH